MFLLSSVADCVHLSRKKVEYKMRAFPSKLPTKTRPAPSSVSLKINILSDNSLLTLNPIGYASFTIVREKDGVIFFWGYKMLWKVFNCYIFRGDEGTMEMTRRIVALTVPVESPIRSTVSCSSDFTSPFSITDLDIETM